MNPPAEEDKRKPGQKPVGEPQDGEEVVHYDDAIVGKAFRFSLILAIVVVLVVGVSFYVLKRKPAPAAPKVTQITAPVSRDVPVAEIPEVKFTDITGEAGIKFVHNNGAYGDKLLPETMGGGVAFFDYDNDGDQDLLFVNSTYWPGKIPDGKHPTTLVLYENDGKGRFRDVTQGSGLDVSVYGMGVAIGDFDNDGLADVFITTVGPNRLFRNLGGGKFADVTQQAGVAGAGDGWSTSAAWVDYDNDGDLDLFVCNYVRWSKEIDFEVGYKLVGIGRAYGQPMNFEGAFPYLYRNDGNGKFTDVSAESGVQVKNKATGVPAAKSLGIAPVDLDNDGYIDLIVANDTVPNLVLHNQKNGKFEEIGALSGIAFDSYGNTRGAMGIDTARFRNDATLGVGIGNFANEMTALYVSQSSPLSFADEAITEGIGPASRLPLKFGLFFFDYDLDGHMDMLTANGHLEEDISKIQKSQQYAQAAQLFWNAGAATGPSYLLVPSDKVGGDLLKPIVGRGSAFADIDNDGDLDVIMTQIGGPPLLVRNDNSLGRHWVRFKLVGKKSNRSAIGAWIKIKSGDFSASQQVMPARSYLSQSQSEVTFGLGNRDRIDAVQIVWPGGKTQEVSPQQVKVDAVTVIEEAL